MYPQRELTRLAHRKAALQRDIAVHRAHCVAAAIRVAQPLRWLDRVVAFWKKLSPLTKFAALPVGLFLQRKILPRKKILGSLLRWGPMVLGVVKSIRSAAKNHAESVSASSSRH